jgi:hypothetical protein
VPPDETPTQIVSPDVARRHRASAVGLLSAVVSLASNLESLWDSELPPALRRRRSEALYGQLGDTQRTLASLAEAVLPPACRDLAAVEAAPLITVPSSSWLRRRSECGCGGTGSRGDSGGIAI